MMLELLARKVKRLAERKLVVTPGLVCHEIKASGFEGLVCDVKIDPHRVMITVSVGIEAGLDPAERTREIKALLVWGCIHELKIMRPVEVQVNFRFIKF